MEEQFGHVVMFPFLAKGHFIPFLALAKLIERRSRCTVTLVSTPLNVSKLRSSLPPDSALSLAELPFHGADHGLPPDVEDTHGMPTYLFGPFHEAIESLQPHFETLMTGMLRRHGRDRLCIVADMFLSWTVETAKKLDVFHSVFLTSGAYSSAVMFSIFAGPSPENAPANPFAGFMRRVFGPNARSDGLLVNTADEFEKRGLDFLRKSSGLPLWAIGPLVRNPSSSARHDGVAPVITWLDSKQPASVLYISFGSQNSIKFSAMMELAIGLEASGKPFIWVVRPPIEFDAREEFRAEWLPEGFEDRMRDKKQGMVVRGWAPQVDILAHGSTGAFLSHCGWNSVLESLSRGVPIIGWPMIGDQLDNSRMLAEEMGVCVEVARGADTNNGSEIGWEGFKKVFDEVLSETEKAREMRRKASEMKDILGAALREDGGGPSFNAMDDFFRTAFPKSLVVDQRGLEEGLQSNNLGGQFHHEICAQQVTEME